MASINIRRDVQDSFYRYKMPKLQAKVLLVSVFVHYPDPLFT